MAKYKNTNLACFYLALFATISPHNLSSISAQAASPDETLSPKRFLSLARVSQQDLLEQQYDQQVTPKPLDRSQNSTQKQNLEHQAGYSLIADSDLAKRSDSNRKKLQDKLLKTISVAFFILFFIPLGIFYPLFLFYKKLLIHPEEPEYSSREDYESELTETDSKMGMNLSAKKETNNATISKLQIAFSPTASDLRYKLGKLGSGEEFQDIVELMRQTATVLIAQNCWTHVNYSSTTLPLEEIKVQFDLVSYQERSKFTNDKLGLISRNSEVERSYSINKNYSYVVVTLILCTTHDQPLFNKIFTKDQLVDELLMLSKMRKDYLIKFELLWNPQEENKYISNDQLLTEYGEMIRLL